MRDYYAVMVDDGTAIFSHACQNSSPALRRRPFASASCANRSYSSPRPAQNGYHSSQRRSRSRAAATSLPGTLPGTPVAHQANAARVPDVIENLLVHGTARRRAAAGCQQAITSSARTTWPKNWSMLCSVASCSRWVNVAVQSLVKTT
jgi:hypothetical protein